MKRQIVIDKKNIRIVAANGIHKTVFSVLIHKRSLLMYQIQIDMVNGHVHAMVTETVLHIIPEVTALLSHVVVGMQHQNSVIRILTVSGIHAAGEK